MQTYCDADPFGCFGCSLAEDKNLFEVLGGTGSDTLIGGTFADLLVDNVANESPYAIQRERRIAA